MESDNTARNNIALSNLEYEIACATKKMDVKIIIPKEKKNEKSDKVLDHKNKKIQ